MRIRAFISVATVTGAALLLAAHGPGGEPAGTTTPGSTVDAFHQALATGQPKAALALLRPEALIVEEGTVQSRADYEKEHLAADIAYAGAVPSHQTSRKIMQSGETAVVISTYRAQGKFNDRTINSVAAETAVLVREKEGWLIQSIHWSSHQARQE